MREKKQKYIYTHRKNVDKHFHLNDIHWTILFVNNMFYKHLWFDKLHGRSWKKGYWYWYSICTTVFFLSLFTCHTQVHIMAWNAHVYLFFFCRCQILPEFQHKIHMKDFFQTIFTSSWHEHVDDLQSFLCMQPFI